MDYARARKNMVDSQVLTNKVTDRALVEAMSLLPRERFVPATARDVAYVDEDLPIGGSRYLTEPMVLARLIQLAGVKPTDKVLDVAAATGYSSLLLARLAHSVVALEADAALAEAARPLLAEFGAGRVIQVQGSPTAGAPANAPFDVILMNGAVAGEPRTLLGQLAEGGRLVAVVRKTSAGIGRATLFTRGGDVFSRRDAFDAATPLLPGFIPEESFVF